MDRVGDLSLLKLLSHSCQQNKNEIFMEPGENISRTHWSYNWPGVLSHTGNTGERKRFL